MDQWLAMIEMIVYKIPESDCRQSQESDLAITKRCVKRETISDSASDLMVRRPPWGLGYDQSPVRLLLKKLAEDSVIRLVFNHAIAPILND